jgi:Thioredoxin
MKGGEWSRLSARISGGMTYNQYRQYAEREAALVLANPECGAKDERTKYLPLNAHRMARIEKDYSLTEELKRLVESLARPQVWLVLSEAWCGDSAQTLPYIARIAECNPKIALRVLLRDENADIMDRYLTAGTRSIPKLIAFDEDGRELFRWGPRPREAMDLFLQARQAGLPQATISERLHLWYGRNRGRALEEEFMQLMKMAKAGEAPGKQP